MMSKGVLIHAFGDELIDYYKLANYSASLVRRHLRLPVACITDNPSKIHGIKYVIEAQSEIKQKRTIIDGKYQYKNDTRILSYELTPFDKTLLIDSDYLIFNSNLLKWFDTDYEFVCPHKMYYPGYSAKEFCIYNNIVQMWATVIYFNKSQFSQNVFEHWKMVQENYEYYTSLLNVYGVYRNDYSLSLALHTMNGYVRPNVEMFSLLTIPTHYKILDIEEDRILIEKSGKLLVINKTNMHVMDKVNLQGKIHAEI